jgi:hypothetical protein
MYKTCITFFNTVICNGDVTSNIIHYQKKQVQLFMEYRCTLVLIAPNELQLSAVHKER